jgi:hypothetical protein
MSDARRGGRMNGGSSDANALLDRLVEESFVESSRETEPDARPSPVETAEGFLDLAAAFLRQRPDKTALLARLSEMCGGSAASGPPTAEAPASEPVPKTE